MRSLTRPRLADKPTAEVDTWIDAAPRTVWTLVSDIELMPKLSDELFAVEWLDPATGPEVGASFRGYNRHGSAHWSTVSYIVDYQINRVFAWAVGDPDDPGAIWRFSLKPDRGGTLLSQRVQIGPGQSGVSMAVQERPDREQAIVASRLREFKHGMAHNVAAIKAIAETH
ncbi:MAG: SRPBCC family protein [Mycobacterium sp.]|nr:SRPBCC family protein [Mycobacterium sp.]